MQAIQSGAGLIKRALRGQAENVTGTTSMLAEARFEASLSFIQSLTEAAKMVSGVLIVARCPRATLKAGGARDGEALLLLKKVFGCV